ncbi:hypothetical protein [Solemya velum gill symbiont]|uniref:Uncharacterized protein n=1 Tax=Solemya velum gill symbiont TaxID=2340 RepID=A0A1T2ETR8_SOVGS|nr:hypothetical protein [Solemya velum gill symbiont]OOY33990.1 hypothetical protein BOV88_12465 [Solemya velum gill symbiont]OOY36645.1 hypothetical protein BOV89_11605 [Solemya velum gill symbiont]OOY39104.1 hypothetical protein BOV90_11130 [Solemya velum gill symbiont]OOY44314.1 hypothetical protein BOV91_01745 [Solemya velum gill symbiont]OOY45459.1 hypothetical protein BOV92_05245 [Solemya velum gill symbiont]
MMKARQFTKLAAFLMAIALLFTASSAFGATPIEIPKVAEPQNPPGSPVGGLPIPLPETTPPEAGLPVPIPKVDEPQSSPEEEKGIILQRKADERGIILQREGGR